MIPSHLRLTFFTQPSLKSMFVCCLWLETALQYSAVGVSRGPSPDHSPGDGCDSSPHPHHCCLSHHSHTAGAPLHVPACGPRRSFCWELLPRHVLSGLWGMQTSFNEQCLVDLHDSHNDTAPSAHISADTWHYPSLRFGWSDADGCKALSNCCFSFCSSDDWVWTALHRLGRLRGLLL